MRLKRNNYFQLLLLLLLMNCTKKMDYTTTDTSAVAASEQLIIVTTPGWDDVKGSLFFYEKNGGKWEQKQGPVEVTIGKNGMVWGDGILKFPEDLPHKKEGDGKAPAGIFTIDGAYGYSPAEEMQNLKLPYIHATSSLRCVDDPGSEFYNQIVDERKVGKDWSSAEEMLREDHLYKYGIIVDYNRKNPIPGAGSCIFLHLWRTPETPTAGCTAMTEDNFLQLLQHLDIQKQPLLVQFPEEEYEKVKKELNLPDLP